MELLNFLAENFLFIYMGISVFSFSHHKWDPFFTIFAFLGIVFGRLVNIYPLAGLINLRNVIISEIILRYEGQHNFGVSEIPKNEPMYYSKLATL